MKYPTEHATLCATEKSCKRCVARIEALAAKYGATIEFHEFNAPREIGLDLVFGPYRCMIHFDGGSKVGAFLGHWHVDHKSAATYPVTFGADIQGTINTYHYSKATTCAHSWHAFIWSIENGLAALAIEMEKDKRETA